MLHMRGCCTAPCTALFKLWPAQLKVISLLLIAAKEQPGEQASEKGGSADAADRQASNAEAAISGRPLPAGAQQQTHPGQAALH